VSKGNAEQPSARQPSAEAPKGPSSPNHVETSPQARQGVQEHPPTRAPEDQSNGNGSENRTVPEKLAGAPQQRTTQEPTPAGKAGPTGKPPDDVHKNSNGQSKDDRNQPVAATPEGQAEAAARGNASQQSPWTAAHAQHSAGRSAGSPASGPSQPKPAEAPSSQQRPQSEAGGQASASAPAKQSATTSPAATEQPAQSAVPVWDPPPAPHPKQPFLARLGIGKKPAPSEDESGAPAAAPQGPAATAPAVPAPAQPTGAQSGGPQSGGATAATGAAAPQARMPAQPAPPPQSKPAAQPTPQAPAGQPSVPQSQSRIEDTAGRTPPIPGAPRPGPIAPSTGPQARTPGAPAHPAAPGPFPVPAPVQALRDAATATNLAVTAAASQSAIEAHHPAKPKVGVARRTRKARLRLSRLDPWSVMKTSFLFSIAAGIMLVVAVYSIWTVLSTSHLFDSVNEIVRSVVSTPGDTTPFRIQEYINTQKVMGVTALIACVDVVIFTALATLGSFLYNLAATMLGGLEITLAED
jgi:Transmembrane domain of unknown function (DUF3566)